MKKGIVWGVLALAVIVVAAIGGGVAFLMTWDIPAPSSQVEVVISDDRFTE